MNYRHHYHAGNFADIMKHTVLVTLLQALNRKPASWCYYDCHAGTGSYDLRSEAAVKTGEAAHGIGRVWRVPVDRLPAPLARLRAIVAASNTALAGTDAPRFYPGSPMTAAALARADDRLVLAELHPQDAQLLKNRFRTDPRVAVHVRDGYAMLQGLLPPPQRRGLVLMDPPFEKADEFAQLTEALIAAHGRWPTGMYALWYPSKEEAPVRRLQRVLQASGIHRILLAEFHIAPPGTPGFTACGMAIVNPPWQGEHTLAEALGFLAQLLAPTQGGSEVRWLVGE